MRTIDQADEQTLALMNDIVGFELAGVVRYTHYALMVKGPNRIPIVQFLQSQATESLAHAQRVGEILTGLGGHPDMVIPDLTETGEHSTSQILSESYSHEKQAIVHYYRLLELATGKSVFLEEFARGMVATEEEHALELRKMLRDYSH